MSDNPRVLYETVRTIKPDVKPSRPLLDGLALLALFLQATELYRPLGYLLGFPSSLAVNQFFLAFFVFFLVARNRSLAQSGSGVVLGWACAMVVAPTGIMALQLLDDSLTTDRLIYWSALSLMYTALLLVAIVLWMRWGPLLSKPFFLACIAAVWIGFVVNWLNYDFIRGVMKFGSVRFADARQWDRMLGFYPHPNVAAFSLVVFLASLACNKKFLTSSFLLQTLASSACLVGVLITGSRTSMVLLLVVIAWYIRNLLRVHRGSSSSNTLRRPALLLVTIGIITTGVTVLLLFSSDRQGLASTVSTRLASAVGALDGMGDSSLNMRLEILSHYYSDILRSPLLGHGPEFARKQIELGYYSNVSQNAWLEWANMFGIPYAFLVAMILIYTYRLAVRVACSDPLLLSYARLILVMLAGITFSVNFPLWIRSPLCVLGALLGVLLHTKMNELAASLGDNVAPVGTRVLSDRAPGSVRA